MKCYIKLYALFLITILMSCSGSISTTKSTQPNSVNELVGGGCDGCELMFQDMPTNILAVDTSADWNTCNQKLIVEGTVYKLDGKTPAPNVIIYYWQTDTSGNYSKKNEENTIHGHLRGWMKTGNDGQYKLYTVKPASYPNSTIPAHIHFAIKEPNISNEYYIDDVLFEDDEFLTTSERSKLQERGGNGIGTIQLKNQIQYIRRDIVLGLNIPNYPQQ